MKVLMLGWELPPNNSGGLGVACYQLCKSLSNKGANIEFVLPHKVDSNPKFMKITSISKTYYDYSKQFNVYESKQYTVSSNQYLKSFEHVDYVNAIDNIVLMSDFDVIHAHDWLTFRAALRAKELSNKPLILHVHSIEADRCANNYAGNELVKEIERISMLMADKVIAVSEFTKNSIIREYNIPANKIDVIHNSIDTIEFPEISDENAYKYITMLKNNGYKVIVNIGRLTIQKGLINLLKATKEVVDKLPKTILLIVGDGDQYNELVEYAAELGISQNVVFVGFQRGKNWRDAYAIGDIFVMPSVSEPFGLTPLEAAGYGLPSLISKQSGVSEVFKNCLKVDYWDNDQIANIITTSLQNDGILQSLQVEAKKEFERLSWDSSADKFMKLYNSQIGATV